MEEKVWGGLFWSILRLFNISSIWKRDALKEYLKENGTFLKLKKKRNIKHETYGMCLTSFPL